MKKILLIFFSIYALTIINCSKDITSPEKKYDVEYRVYSFSSLRVTVTYISQNGVTLQESDLYPTYSEPWSYYFKGEQGDYVSVSARGAWYGSVTAAIFKNGKKWKEVTAQTLCPEATASGTL